MQTSSRHHERSSQSRQRIRRPRFVTRRCTFEQLETRSLLAADFLGFSELERPGFLDEIDRVEAIPVEIIRPGESSGPVLRAIMPVGDTERHAGMHVGDQMVLRIELHSLTPLAGTNEIWIQIAFDPSVLVPIEPYLQGSSSWCEFEYSVESEQPLLAFRVQCDSSGEEHDMEMDVLFEAVGHGEGFMAVTAVLSPRAGGVDVTETLFGEAQVNVSPGTPVPPSPPNPGSGSTRAFGSPAVVIPASVIEPRPGQRVMTLSVRPIRPRAGDVADRGSELLRHVSSVSQADSATLDPDHAATAGYKGTRSLRTRVAWTLGDDATVNLFRPLQLVDAESILLVSADDPAEHPSREILPDAVADDGVTLNPPRELRIVVAVQETRPAPSPSSWTHAVRPVQVVQADRQRLTVLAAEDIDRVLADWSRPRVTSSDEEAAGEPSSKGAPEGRLPSRP